MALRNVVQVSNPEGETILRKTSKEVKNFDENLWTLLDDMWDTMYENDGVGLAAVQVGVLKKVIVVDINELHLELVNAVITHYEGEQIGPEGCLSIKGIRGKVKRPSKVTVEAQDRYGNPYTITAVKELAVVFCHEIDHTNGVLFTDIMIEEEKEWK